MREARRLDPTHSIVYAALAHHYLLLNRLEEARATAEEARAKNLDSAWLHFDLYRLAFLQNDAGGMAQQVAWATGKPGVEDVLLALEAGTAAYSGKMGKARELLAAQSLPPIGPKRKRQRLITRLTPPYGKPSLVMPPKRARGLR
jgi:hypothetical protein